MNIKSIVFAFFLFLSSSSGYTQTKLSGQLIDKESGQFVVNAHIMLANGAITTSDTLGIFSIFVKKIPVVLKITHLSYGISNVIIDGWTDGIFVITIQKWTNHLDEVQIVAARMQEITLKKYFSIYKVAFDRDALWIIGYENNNPNKGKLILANEYGKTRNSIPIHGNSNLYEDVFGNVHLVKKDSIFQLFAQENNKILFVHGVPKVEFQVLMNDVQNVFNNKLVFKNYLSENEKMIIFYLQKDDPNQYLLTEITDSVENLRKWHDRKQDSIVGISNISNMTSLWKQIERYSKPGSKIAKMASNHMTLQLFTVYDSLYIVNYIKDSLLCYNPSGKYDHSVPISFHKRLKLGDIDYLDYDFLTDPITQKVYILENSINRLKLCLLDIASGNTHPPIPLPELGGLTNIRIYNDAVYFLYPEKKYPFYVRLYRYQI